MFEIQSKYNKYHVIEELDKITTTGAYRAQLVAKKTLNRAKERLGLL